MITVAYYPNGHAVNKQIYRLQLDRIGKRMRENHKAHFTYSEQLVETVAGRCREVESGARNVDHILTRSLLPELSSTFLARMAAGDAIARVHVSIDDSGGFEYTVE